MLSGLCGRIAADEKKGRPVAAPSLRALTEGLPS
jgi:hypothetical protein